jgi:hypothetical protein
MSNRDNFLEIVKAWCDYARICQAVKHEPVTLQAFRAMECEWDGPPKANGYAEAIGRLRATTAGNGTCSYDG